MKASGLIPDDFNGCFAACPDPIDFMAYTVVNIYDDENAYYLDSKFKKTPRPGTRDLRGIPTSTLEEENLLEHVLGTDSRSGGQWDSIMMALSITATVLNIAGTAII